MAGQLKLRRGTTSQLANYIGSEGELTYDTALKSLVLHDGVTLGGVKIPYLSNDLVPSAMLPTATELVVGASKIATTAIAQAGTNDTDFITPAKLKGYLDTKALGINQTWENVTASRSSGTTYTNNTGKPIKVSIICAVDDGISELYVSNELISKSGNAGSSTGNNFNTVSEVVPHEQTYRYQGSNFLKWSELR